MILPDRHYQPFLETERCMLTPFTMDDLDDAATYLKDPEVMYAWGHAFTDDEVRQWVERSIREHGQWGYSFMMARLKEDGRAIGRVGLRNDTVLGKEIVELGYILARAYWGAGYAFELARACLDYGFDILGLQEIVAEIRPENLASVRLAERLGMVRVGSFSKEYGGESLIHHIYLLHCKSRSIGGR